MILEPLMERCAHKVESSPHLDGGWSLHAERSDGRWLCVWCRNDGLCDVESSDEVDVEGVMPGACVPHIEWFSQAIRPETEE